MPRILPVPASPGPAPHEPVPTDRVLRGAPAQAIANAYSSPDQRFHAGVREGRPGAWRVAYTEHEFCHLLGGRLRLLGDDGHASEWAAGDSFVVPAGFTGTWEVLETVRKLYAVYEPGD